MQEFGQRVISYMCDRYAEPINLDDLAASIFFTLFHFSVTFRKETRLSPGRYLTAVRVFEAKRLLLTTSMSVADMVTSVGFGAFSGRTPQNAPAACQLLTCSESTEVRRGLATLGDRQRPGRLPVVASAHRRCTDLPAGCESPAKQRNR